MTPINRALGLVSRRAERASGDQLLASFVDVGDISLSMSGRDHQVMYGRRGTGKTHILSVLATNASRAGDIPVQIDLRTLGSTGGIYADGNISLAERATRLLTDLLWAVHDGIMERAIEDESLDWAAAERALDAFRETISDVRVVGQTTLTSSETVAASSSSGADMGVAISAAPASKIGLATSESTSCGRAVSSQVVGDVRHRLHFGNVANRLAGLASALGNKRIVLLLDEWSEIPLDLQPYLGDLLRRAVFPVEHVTVKIAAIEQRTNFQQYLPEGGYVGIEIGADGSPSLTLDDFMVFDNDAQAATAFFRKLLWRHVVAIAGDNELPSYDENQFVSEGFTQITAVQELSRAAEGVPRDAINIAALAARMAGDRKISVADVRAAARQWYQQSKEAAVNARPGAIELLQWIIEQVIGGRKARAFLLPVSVRDSLIDFLYDSRVLHVIKKSVSSNDTPGVRYNVFGVDYGCYVDLIATANSPRGLFQLDDDVDNQPQYVDVPTTDYRSIRRAILNLGEFANSRRDSI